MQRKWHYIIYVNLFISICLIVFLLIIHNKTPQIVVADNQKVFDGFRMTVEAKMDGEKIFNANKKLLDSVYAKLQDPQTPKTEKDILTKQIAQGQEQLHDFNEKFAADQSAKVWSRISSYMADFAKEKGYGMIVGKGTSNVLYAEDSKDVTEELIVFLNKKYEGSN